MATTTKTVGQRNTGGRTDVGRRIRKESPLLGDCDCAGLGPGKLRFTFDDIILMDDRSIQTLLKHVEPGDLALALGWASEQVRAKILKNMSMHDREASGLAQAEKAQKRIVDAIRVLKKDGQITTPEDLQL